MSEDERLFGMRVRIDPQVPDGMVYLVPDGHEAQFGDYEPITDGNNPCGVIITNVDD